MTEYDTTYDTEYGEEQSRERRFSAGRIVDGILEYTRSHPGGWTSGLGDTMKRNAVPIALIGAGVLWMAAEGGMRREPVRRRTEAARAGARDALGRTMERTRNAVDGASETAGGIVRSATERVREGTREAAGAASRYGQRVRSTATRTGQTAWRTVERTYDENPLALGVLVALGAAAVALSIPATRREDELMGEVRDEMAEKARGYVKGAREVGKTAVDTAKSEAKSSAKAVAEAAKDEAKSQGLAQEEPAKSRSGGGSQPSASGEEAGSAKGRGSASPSFAKKENPGL